MQETNYLASIRRWLGRLLLGLLVLLLFCAAAGFILREYFRSPRPPLQSNARQAGRRRWTEDAHNCSGGEVQPLSWNRVWATVTYRGARCSPRSRSSPMSVPTIAPDWATAILLRAPYEQGDRARVSALLHAAACEPSLYSCRPLHGRIRRAVLRQALSALRLPAWCWWMLLIPIRTIAFHPN